MRSMQEALIEKREQTLKENDELQQRINQIKAARAQQEPEITQVGRRFSDVPKD